MRHARSLPPMHTAGLADIAMMLMIFFLLTTQLFPNRGIIMRLPPKIEEDLMVGHEIPDYEILHVQLNASGNLIVEDRAVANTQALAALVKRHVLNYGREYEFSTAPYKAIVAIGVARDTPYGPYLAAIDAINQAYTEMYAERVGLSVSEFLALNPKLSASDRALYAAATEGMPKTISITEPNWIGSTRNTK